MKKIYKLLSMLIITAIMFSLNNKTVNATTFKTEAYGRIKIKDLHMDLPHKYINYDGNRLDAYCSYYSKNSLGTNTFYSEIGLDTDEKISEREALGIAAIIATDVPWCNAGKSVTGASVDDCKYAIKEIAINLYLSKTKGNIDRFKFDWMAGYTYDQLFDLFTNVYAPASRKAVYDAYLVGLNATPNVDPYLNFTERGQFEKNGNKYEATFKVESNMGLNINSFSVSAEGISPDKIAKQVSITNDGKNATIKVIINETYITGTNIKVTITAETTGKKAKIRKFANCDANYCYQPYVTGETDLSPIIVSTDAVIRTQNTCYEYSMECDPVSCTADWGQNNTQCKTVQTTIQTPGECDINKKQSGIKTIDLIAGVCSLYCTETGTASYPSNVVPAIKAGTNLTWPTANGMGEYPLTTSATMTCKVEMEDSSTVTQECLNLAARAKYTYSGNDAVAKITYDDTKETKTINLKSNCTTSSNVNGANVVIENSCNYSLPENKNIAINKETLSFVNQVSSELSSAVTNYILITKHNGVLPIGGINWSDSTAISDVLFDKKYSLEILDLPLGYNGRFTSELNSTPYICNYQVTTTISGECTCPPGTEWSETDLYGAMKDAGKTCAEAKEIYCNNDRLTCTKPDGTTVDISSCVGTKKDIEACEKEVGCEDRNNKVCPSTTTYAGYAYESDRRYKACISGGATQQFCIDLICNCGTACEYTCPPGTDRAGMDISSCIYEQRGNGNNLSEAQQICSKQCNDGGGKGGNIIYRTISLENPFPSMNGDKTVSQTGLSTGMFNDTIKGRYPGTNWNSVTLVYNKIRNNRGYDGSAIYNEATPLYTINLDAVAIKKIREYNKKQIDNGKGGYTDFELTCTDGAYCISKFLHNSGITKADGSSILDVSNSTCGNARDKSSFISCYTYK